MSLFLDLFITFLSVQNAHQTASAPRQNSVSMILFTDIFQLLYCKFKLPLNLKYCGNSYFKN